MSVGLVLAGGGARGAYEVGALSVLLPELERRGERPRILVGTSIGALNAAYLAAAAERPAAEAMDEGRQVWLETGFRDVAAPVLFSTQRLALHQGGCNPAQLARCQPPIGARSGSDGRHPAPADPLRAPCPPTSTRARSTRSRLPPHPRPPTEPSSFTRAAARWSRTASAESITSRRRSTSSTSPPRRRSRHSTRPPRSTSPRKSPATTGTGVCG